MKYSIEINSKRNLSFEIWDTKTGEMQKQHLLDRLCEAIWLVGVNQLDEHRDDTLIEKLISFVDQSVQATTKDAFDRLSWSKTCNVCEQLIRSWCCQMVSSNTDHCDQLIRQLDEWNIEHNKYRFTNVLQHVDDSSIGPIFRLLGSLRSIEARFEQPDSDSLIDQRRWYERFESMNRIVKRSDNFSLHSHYISFWHRIVMNRSNSIRLFESELVSNHFLDQLIQDYSHSTSYFVRQQIGRTIECILKAVLRLNTDSPYWSLIHKLHGRIQSNVTQIDLDWFDRCLTGETTSQDRLRTALPLLAYSLTNCISSNQSMVIISKVLLILCRLPLSDSEKTIIWIKLKKLRNPSALALFATQLCNLSKDHMTDWIRYSLLPLIQQPAALDRLQQTYGEIVATTNISITSSDDSFAIHGLYCWRSQLSKNAFHQCWPGIFITIEHLLQLNAALAPGPKLLREIVTFLNQIFDSEQVTDKITVKNVITILFLLMHHSPSIDINSVLSLLRKLVASRCNLIDSSTIDQLILVLNQNLCQALTQQDYEQLDSNFDLLSELLRQHPPLVEQISAANWISIRNLWNKSMQSTDFYWIKVSAIPLLMALDLNATPNLLKTVEIERNSFIRQSTRLIKNENPLIRKCVVQSFCSNLSMLVLKLYRNEFAGEGQTHFDHLIRSLSEVIVFDVDVDIQIAALNALLKLFQEIFAIATKSDDFVLFARIVGCLLPFFHAVQFALQNESVETLLSETAQDVYDKLQLILRQDETIQNKFKQLDSEFNDKAILFEYEIESIDVNSNGDIEENVSKYSVLDQLFQVGHFPIQEVLKQMTDDIRVDQNKESKVVRQVRHTITWSEINDFLFNPNCSFAKQADHSNHILDDILAAKINRNVIMDCY